ncbi:uncharacterized protein LOC116424361 [Nomia melanderi]|uniref:uncharacterized protein LOC116424361 n=1 Tax=Nomia melanderi TaxID=2448451 RepID=UPI003FCCF4B9
MGKQMPKMSARVVNAIKNLREVHGSTSKEILNYITSQHSAPESTVQRQMQAALKRGLDYGILKKNNGHYYLNTDAEIPRIAPSGASPAERTRRSRRRSSHRRSRRRRSGRRKRRRRSGRRRGRTRRSRRRRSSGRRRAAQERRVECTNCRCNKRHRDLDKQLLKDTALEPQNPEDEDSYAPGKESDADRRSESHENCSQSGSQSSVNSNRDTAMDDQQPNDS